MSAVDISTEIIIERPIEVVSSYAADPDNAPQWNQHIHAMSWRTPRPMRAGTLLAFEANFLGRELAYVYEVMRFEPAELLVMRTTDGPFPMQTTYQWRRHNRHHTHMLLRNEGDPGVFFRLLSPILSQIMGKASQSDLEKLKQILEQEG
ncbi:SRPBCC family protein [Pontibacter sp. G13]|uniref:SRPBCC family protein n=1 Tax=Pontibacter sp. G13 TaxID=3074898 RepID=UPI002889D1BA|nr:SRPBCC family protein [Pontibacter sp. G13]WNJ20195.1 SRPBCC family protein [Pontibacter sp. G13]